MMTERGSIFVREYARTEEEAKNYVKNDMEDRCDQLAGCNIEADFSRMEILDACDQPICMWSIDSYEI